jgi:hypothetical protein
MELRLSIVRLRRCVSPFSIYSGDQGHTGLESSIRERGGSEDDGVASGFID